MWGQKGEGRGGRWSRGGRSHRRGLAFPGGRRGPQDGRSESGWMHVSPVRLLISKQVTFRVFALSYLPVCLISNCSLHLSAASIEILP